MENSIAGTQMKAPGANFPRNYSKELRTDVRTTVARPTRPGMAAHHISIDPDRGRCLRVLRVGIPCDCAPYAVQRPDGGGLLKSPTAVTSPQVDPRDPASPSVRDPDWAEGSRYWSDPARDLLAMVPRRTATCLTNPVRPDPGRFDPPHDPVFVRQFLLPRHVIAT